jgi:hypothetical protein
LGKKNIAEYLGGYIKLSDFRGHENQAPKTLEAISNNECGWFYEASIVLRRYLVVQLSTGHRKLWGLCLKIVTI